MSNSINAIKDGLSLLQIEEKDYPGYSDPNSFAAQFKICSLYDDTNISTSGSSIIPKK